MLDIFSSIANIFVAFFFLEFIVMVYTLLNAKNLCMVSLLRFSFGFPRWCIFLFKKCGVGNKSYVRCYFYIFKEYFG